MPSPPSQPTPLQRPSSGHDLTAAPLCPECGATDPIPPPHPHWLWNPTRFSVSAAIPLTILTAANLYSLHDPHTSTTHCWGWPFDAYLVYSCWSFHEVLWPGLLLNLATAATTSAATGALACLRRP